MIRAAVLGAAGRMGTIVLDKLSASPDFEIAAAVDVVRPARDCPYFKTPEDIDVPVDVIIDFSSHLATRALCSYIVRTGVPAVIASTGHDESELALIKEAAGRVAVFKTANLSVGVALVADLIKRAARIMPDADIEIVETHHDRKKDAPSGTAKLLADAVRSVLPDKYCVYGREGDCPRDKNEIGVHAVRRGNIAGIHEIFFGTDTETVSIKHEAHTREVFADGALAAARFLIGKKAGLYSMDDLIAED